MEYTFAEQLSGQNEHVSINRTSIEHERKFILKGLPDDFDTYSKCKVKQWYLTKPDNPVSVRIRLYDDGKCYFDIKKGFGISREKNGTKHKFEDIQNYTLNAKFIEKTRFKQRHKDYLIVIDYFDDGLKLVEVESENLDVIKNFQPLDWFGEEVTDKIEYTNSYLTNMQKMS